MRHLAKSIGIVFENRKSVCVSALLFFIALVIRLFFINVNHAEYTPGVIMMDYSNNLMGQYRFDILYPLVIHIFNLIIPDIELASRLVSIIFCSLSVPILF